MNRRTGHHRFNIGLPDDFGKVGYGGISFPCPCCGQPVTVNLKIEDPLPPEPPVKP
jgi:hypothetical protein